MECSICERVEVPAAFEVRLHVPNGKVFDLPLSVCDVCMSLEQPKLFKWMAATFANWTQATAEGIFEQKKPAEEHEPVTLEELKEQLDRIEQVLVSPEVFLKIKEQLNRIEALVTEPSDG